MQGLARCRQTEWALDVGCSDYGMFKSQRTRNENDGPGRKDAKSHYPVPVLLALSHSVVPSLSQATSVVASCGWWQGAGIIFAFRPWCVYVLQLLKVVFACVCVYVNVSNRWFCPPTGDGWLWELWALNCFIWFRLKWIFSSTHCLLFVLAKIQIVSLEGYVWSQSSHVRPSIIK